MGRTLDIKRGDTVYVLAGRDRERRIASLPPEEQARVTPQTARSAADRHPGRRGRVIGVSRDKGYVTVEGINVVTRHSRPRGVSSRVTQQQTGRFQQPAPMPVSKVMLVCPRCDRPTKVARREHEGRRLRFCRRCNEIIDEK
jgi:large subunit ribosomal protein L24